MPASSEVTSVSGSAAGTGPGRRWRGQGRGHGRHLSSPVQPSGLANETRPIRVGLGEVAGHVLQPFTPHVQVVVESQP